MFGDKAILSNRETKLDERGRMIIPKFTGVEENDQLVIQKSYIGNFYMIVNLTDIKNKVKRFEDLNQEFLKERLLSSVVGVVKVDKQNRIFFKDFKNFAIDRKLFFHGSLDSLQVFKREQDYLDHVEHIKKNR